MFLTYISNTWLLRTTKAHTHSKEEENKPPPCFLSACTQCGRKVEPLLAQASPLCWMEPVPLGSHSPGQGIPPDTLALNSGPQGRCQMQQPALLNFCWESCKTAVALLSSTGTGKSCCFSQCRGRQQSPLRAQGSPHTAGEQGISTQCNHLSFYQAQVPRQNTTPILYFPL